jgi:hypothetical protein
MAFEKINGTAFADIAKFSGVANADIAKFNGFDPPSAAGIVTDNLFQNYDAGNASSYSGSGTTWADLQGNYDVELIGGPTYVSSTPAHFDFDLVNDRARGATNYSASSNDMTVEVWWRADNISSSLRYSLTAALQQTMSNRRFILNIERGQKIRFLCSNATGTTGALITTATFSAGTWYCVCATKSGTTSTIYVNGSFSTSMTLSSSTLGTCNVFGIAERQLNSLDLYDGDISIVRIYNDALTASEVSQNFDAVKSNFGY